MNEKVKEFLDAQKAIEKDKQEEERKETLLELGLYEKMYSVDNTYSELFPFSELSSDGMTNRFYQKFPIEVTDEEYQEVCKYVKKKEKTAQNPVAVALTIIAWLTFIGGFITGFVFGNVEIVSDSYYSSYTETAFSFTVAFTYWCITLISGTMFLGFAEIIKLLDAIKKK